MGSSRPNDPLWRYVVLFLLTVVTTTMAGAAHYEAFYVGFGGNALPASWTWADLLLRGLWYSVPILAILGCHEMGHYYACRYYGVEASRPYFLPMPIVLTGPLGALPRTPQPIQTKRQLFDIGIAGPIAGFLVAVPVLFAGMWMSRVEEVPQNVPAFWLGEPLLFKAAAWLTFGSVPEGFTINMHPIGFAAWFGMLATALNLFPIGQLDGGHISYAVLGRKSTAVTLTMVGCLVGLTFWSLSWAVWAGLTILMLFAFGPRHPRTADEDEPLDPARKWLAVFAVVMFILCFTPSPIEPMDIVTGAP